MSETSISENGGKYFPPWWEIFTAAVENNYHRGGNSGEKN
jgi:hypothetical protein